MCEALEARKLLTTYHYEIPEGHSVAYIQPRQGGVSGQIQVRLDDPVTGTIEPGGIFLNDTGRDIIDAGENQNFLFVDQVPAVGKPDLDGDDDDGIEVRGTGSTLEFKAVQVDTLIEVAEDSFFGPFMAVTNNSEQFGVTYLGAGVQPHVAG